MLNKVRRGCRSPGQPPAQSGEVKARSAGVRPAAPAAAAGAALRSDKRRFGPSRLARVAGSSVSRGGVRVRWSGVVVSRRAVVTRRCGVASSVGRPVRGCRATRSAAGDGAVVSRGGTSADACPCGAMLRDTSGPVAERAVLARAVSGRVRVGVTAVWPVVAASSWARVAGSALSAAAGPDRVVGAGPTGAGLSRDAGSCAATARPVTPCVAAGDTTRAGSGRRDDATRSAGTDAPVSGDTRAGALLADVAGTGLSGVASVGLDCVVRAGCATRAVVTGAGPTGAGLSRDAGSCAATARPVDPCVAAGVSTRAGSGLRDDATRSAGTGTPASGDTRAGALLAGAAGTGAAGAVAGWAGGMRSPRVVSPWRPGACADKRVRSAVASDVSGSRAVIRAAAPTVRARSGCVALSA
jgi:hypothetical protein